MGLSRSLVSTPDLQVTSEPQGGGRTALVPINEGEDGGLKSRALTLGLLKTPPVFLAEGGGDGLGGAIDRAITTFFFEGIPTLVSKLAGQTARYWDEAANGVRYHTPAMQRALSDWANKANGPIDDALQYLKFNWKVIVAQSKGRGSPMKELRDHFETFLSTNLRRMPEPARGTADHDVWKLFSKNTFQHKRFVQEASDALMKKVEQTLWSQRL